MIAKIEILGSKQKEMVQTVSALAELVRQETGYMYSELYRDAKNENTLCVFEQWATEADLDEHLRSQNFAALRWAVKALGGMEESKFHTVSQTRGEEAVEAARAPG